MSSSSSKNWPDNQYVEAEAHERQRAITISYVRSSTRRMVESLANFVSAAMCLNIEANSYRLVSLFDVLQSEGWMYNMLSPVKYNIYVPFEGDFIQDNKITAGNDRSMDANFVKFLLPRAQRATIQFGRIVDSRLIQINVVIIREEPYLWLSLDIEDTAFMGNYLDVLAQWDDPLIIEFRRTILRVVDLLDPFIAAVDWEADLDCKQKFPSTVSWGNFWTNQILASLTSGDVKIIRSLAHHWLENDKGVFFWVGEIAFNGAYTQRHEQIEAILKKY